MIIIHSDYSEVYRELDRLEAMPSPKMVTNLETALSFGLESTRAQVHVDTGALKASGKESSDVRPGRWEGKFSFGDKAQQVDYAIYERARGGAHDFFNGVHLLTSVFVEAIKNGLRKS